MVQRVHSGASLDPLDKHDLPEFIHRAYRAIVAIVFSVVAFIDD